MPSTISSSWQLRLSRFGILFIAIMLLPACATTADHMDRLNISLNAYEKAIRWGDFETAYAMHQWGLEGQPALPEQLPHIRVTHYEIKDRHFDKPTMTARQTATIRYYNAESSRVRTLKNEQQWEYHKDNKRWYQTSKPPVFE